MQRALFTRLIRRRSHLSSSGMRPSLGTMSKRSTINWQRLLGSSGGGAAAGGGATADSAGAGAAPAPPLKVEEEQLARLVRHTARAARSHYRAGTAYRMPLRHGAAGLRASARLPVRRRARHGAPPFAPPAWPQNPRLAPPPAQWAGYGSVKELRVTAPGRPVRRLVAKAVDPPPGRAGDVGHQRKLTSYAVEVSDAARGRPPARAQETSPERRRRRGRRPLSRPGIPPRRAGTPAGPPRARPPNEPGALRAARSARALPPPPPPPPPRAAPQDRGRDRGRRPSPAPPGGILPGVRPPPGAARRRPRPGPAGRRRRRRRRRRAPQLVLVPRAGSCGGAAAGALPLCAVGPAASLPAAAPQLHARGGRWSPGAGTPGRRAGRCGGARPEAALPSGCQRRGLEPPHQAPSATRPQSAMYTHTLRPDAIHTSASARCHRRPRSRWSGWPHSMRPGGRRSPQRVRLGPGGGGGLVAAKAVREHGCRHARQALQSSRLGGSPQLLGTGCRAEVGREPTCPAVLLSRCCPVLPRMALPPPPGLWGDGCYWHLATRQVSRHGLPHHMGQEPPLAANGGSKRPRAALGPALGALATPAAMA
jgi:hypothetical protein